VIRREPAADRRRHLGEAVLRCTLKNGNAGISVRQIAAEAGVSLGLIRYHFGEFDDLIAYASKGFVELNRNPALL
jgi:AcrR family transcriptional regulator